jgi:hypothetical protein
MTIDHDGLKIPDPLFYRVWQVVAIDDDRVKSATPSAIIITW